MHETHPIEDNLRAEAERLSEKYRGAPVVVIVAGSGEAGIPRCMTGTSMHGGPGNRLRDLLGILQATIQIETLKHLPGQEQQLMELLQQSD